MVNELDVKEAARLGMHTRPLTTAVVQQHLADLGVDPSSAPTPTCAACLVSLCSSQNLGRLHCCSFSGHGALCMCVPCSIDSERC